MLEISKAKNPQISASLRTEVITQDSNFIIHRKTFDVQICTLPESSYTVLRVKETYQGNSIYPLKHSLF